MSVIWSIWSWLYLTGHYFATLKFCYQKNYVGNTSNIYRGTNVSLRKEKKQRETNVLMGVEIRPTSI